MRCPICEAEGELALDPPREARVDTVAISAEATPVVACPAGHRQVPGEAIRAAMAAVEDQIPAARSRLLRSDACRACGEALTMPVRRTEIPVTVDGDPPRPVLTLHLEVPATRCPGCGVDQVPSRSQEDLSVAVPKLFAPGPSGA